MTNWQANFYIIVWLNLTVAYVPSVMRVSEFLFLIYYS